MAMKLEVFKEVHMSVARDTCFASFKLPWSSL